MAPKASTRSIRVQTADRQITPDELQALVRRLPRRPKVNHILPRTYSSHFHEDLAEYSIARNGDNCSSTITFHDERSKELALSTWKEKKFDKADYVFDDIFAGLTILRAPDDASDIDICAIHGLDGNAMDTFTSESKLWLRDLLPTVPPFENARIMSFGYNSRLFERETTDQLQDWAEYLLSAVGTAREDPVASARPIIFICHSMGGLVGRKAMERLFLYPRDYPGISLSNCGLLFLSTPHLGSIEANYGEFLTGVLSSLFGLRNDAVVKELRSFNSSAVEATKAWGTMRNDKKMPPFECLCESRQTKLPIKGYREIVSQGAASFMDKPAFKLQDTDHHEVCKFENKLGQGFKEVVKRLKALRMKLIFAYSEEQDRTLPGYPNATAFRYPLPSNEKWYVGGPLKHASGRFTGRTEILSALEEAMRLDEHSRQNRVFGLMGMGGMGKTEVLLEYGFRNRQLKNVFFCQVQPNEEFETSLHKVAMVIGADVLPQRIPIADKQTVWNNLSRQQRVEAFLSWLSEPSNTASVLLFDDVDALANMESVSWAIGSCAHTVLFTSRNPSILESLCESAHRNGFPYQVSDMPIPELVNLMAHTLRAASLARNSLDISSTNLEKIAHIVQGHAMAACRAVQFICQRLALNPGTDLVTHFLNSFENGDWETRNAFLEFRPTPGRSLAQVFETSLKRLRESEELASRVLHFAAFLSETVQHFRVFMLRDRPWLSAVEAEVPNVGLFRLDGTLFDKLLHDLVNTSALIVLDDRTLKIHALLQEYLRQRVGHPGRLHILRQIYLLADISVKLDEDATVMQQFKDNCIMIAEAFRITVNDIAPSQEVMQIIDNYRQRHNVPSILQELRSQCHNIAATLLRSDGGFSSEEARNRYSSQVVPIIRALFKFEREHVWSNSNQRTVDAHIALYDALIEIVRGNPDLQERLPRQRQLFIERTGLSVIKTE